MEACKLQHGGGREREERRGRRDVGTGGEDRREMKCSTSLPLPPSHSRPLHVLTVIGCVVCVFGVVWARALGAGTCVWICVGFCCFVARKKGTEQMFVIECGNVYVGENGLLCSE